MSLFRDLLAVLNPRFGRFARYRQAPEKLHTAFDILAQDLGLLQSMRTGLPADGAGKPIPWFTYPAIEYLNQFNLSNKQVFEYGCGQSTRYWARRGARVWSVEHDEDWHQKMGGEMETGCTLYLGKDDESYVGAIKRPGTSFDIVVIDGILREACVGPAIAHLAPNGFIILDNADRDWPVGRLLRARGFFEVDFSGFGPINDYVTTTALFLPPGGLVQPPDFRPPRPVGHHHDNVYVDPAD